MNLSDATALLGSHARNFSEVYKLYNYRDDQTLRDYLDFVTHEPVEWFKGFPSKLLTKGSFSQPKTALIKLLKQEQVINELGEDYVKHVHDIVWSAFKQHGDAVLERRHKHAGISIVDQFDSESVGSTKGIDNAPQLIINDLIDDTDSVHSIKLPRAQCSNPSGCNWEQKYRILETAYRALAADYESSCPGVVSSLLTLLDALAPSSA